MGITSMERDMNRPDSEVEAVQHANAAAICTAKALVLWLSGNLNQTALQKLFSFFFSALSLEARWLASSRRTEEHGRV